MDTTAATMHPAEEYLRNEQNPLNAQIVCLSPSQWVNCFLEMLEVVPEKFHPS